MSHSGTFRIDSKDYVDAVVLVNDSTIKRWIILGGNMAVFLMLYNYFFLDRSAFERIAIALFCSSAFPGLYLLLYRYAMLPNASEKLFREGSAFHGETTFSFDDDRICLKGSLWAYDVPWDSFFGYFESKTTIALCVTRQFFLILPKHALNAEQLTAVNTLLVRHVRRLN